MISDKKKNARLALSIAQTVLLVLTVIALFFAITCAVTSLSVADPPEGSDIGTQIGAGLSRGFNAVFFILSAVFVFILSVPGEIVAIIMVARSYGWGRVYGICATVAYVLAIATCAVFWVMIQLNQA